MSDLIDRNALLEVFGFTPHERDDCRGCHYRGNKCLIHEFSPADICEVINDLPAVDPVTHGMWLVKDMIERSPFAKNFFCSECKQETNFCNNYCPSCGAPMSRPGQCEYCGTYIVQA